MRRLKVPDSTNIESIAYDIAQRLMQVEFKNGDTYEYQHVEPIDWAMLCSSVSIGGWFATHIKPQPQTFPYRKLKPEQKDR